VKRIVILFSVVLLALAITFSCGKKKAQESNKVPLEVKKAEQMDSTRLDSTPLDSTKNDTLSVDSTK